MMSQGGLLVMECVCGKSMEVISEVLREESKRSEARDVTDDGLLMCYQ